MRSIFCIVFLFIVSTLTAQKVIIPANTGYAIPSEENTKLRFEKNGVEHWTDKTQQIQYFFFIRNAGPLHIALNAIASKPGSKIKINVAGKSFPVAIPAGKKPVQLKVGTVTVSDTGFYTLSVEYLTSVKDAEVSISTIELSGNAVTGIHYNAKERRNAASVHLKYPLADSIRAIAFYNELTVAENADLVHSYYMACGFSRGYFGLQVNGPAERRVIFSVWDSGSEAIDRNKVADSNKVQLLAKGENVFAEGFGNEGTGGHSHWVYPWKAGTAYKMLVTSLPDSASQTTIYSAYIFLPEQQKWKFIASFRAPHDGKTLQGLYSFSENFSGTNGQLQRKAFFGNQWIQRADNGQWKELTQSTFSYDATAKAGDRIDYGGGAEGNKFYLWNGGFKKSTAAFGDVFNRTATNDKPVIDWTKNADSTAQAEKDKQMIFAAIASKQIDTTGSKEGVYYQVYKEGTGDYVAVTDTVTVFYKGTLLKDGTIFDQTKEKPATFPLKRLIRGWQIAVPQCRVGGKIRIFIPSATGYLMRARSKDIIPNSVLVFDIEVVSTKKL